MIIAFVNHKGGTGKTTSAINIGRVLANEGKRILLIDLDPQGNLTYSLGLSEGQYNVAHLLNSEVSAVNSIVPVQQMDVIPADMRLYRSVRKLESNEDANSALKNALSSIKHEYDYILLDCPPSISIYTLNALNACEGVIVPMLFEILSIQGLDQMLSEIVRIKKTTNPGITVIGALGVIVNENRKLTEEVLAYVRDNYNIPVFNNYVRSSVKAAEAPSFGKSVVDYSPSSTSAKDYVGVAKELLSRTEITSEII
ncbi:MAG: ParA family protein [Bacteroidia bacterium]